MAGLLKITKTATNLYTKMKSLKALSIGAGIVPPTPIPAPTPTPTHTPSSVPPIAPTQKISSMVVHANSVVVNGKSSSSPSPGKQSAPVPPSPGKPPVNKNQQKADEYYRRRQEVINQQRVTDYYNQRQKALINSTGRPPTTPSVPLPVSSGIGNFARNGLRIAGGAGAMAAIFGAMDIYAARSHSQETLAEANQTVAYHRQVLEDLKNQNAGQDEINRQVAEVRAAEDFQQRTVKMNNQVERQAEYGAFGAVAGTALGAALGSAVPVIGTMIGGIIGGILGDYLGTKAADLVNQTENNAQQHSGNSTSFLDVGNQGIAEHGAEMRESEDALRNYGNNVAQRRAADEEERQRKIHYAEENQRFARSELGDMALAQAHNDLISHSADYEAQNAAAEAKHQALIQRGAELAAQRDRQNANWRQITAGNSLYGGGGYQDYFVAKTDEERVALAAYDEDRQNKAIQEIHARHASEQATQDAQTADFLKQQGKSYSEIQGNTVKSEKGSDEWIVNTNPYDVAKKNLDEQAAASHKQIDAQNELTQKIRDLNQQAQKAGENKDFFKDFSIGDFLDDLLFNKAAAQKLHDEEEGIESVGNPENSTPTYPQLENPQFEEKSFNFSDMLPDFDFSDLLPDFDLSNIFGEIDIGEQFQSLFEGIGEIDIASLLPDFSSIGEMIGEQLNFIPEKVSEITTSIGEGFSQIPTAASEVFNTISTAANEGLTSIQTAWNELPSFFEGLFSGLGDVATSAGAAIASGINSAIGTIQSAWESLSGWLSDKISSLASMASNAASTIMNFGGGGSVSPKAEGGFISSPQQILAGEAGLEVIIPLATSRRKRALDLLKKTAAIVGGDSINITGDQFKPEEKFSAANSENISTLEKAKNRRVEQVMRQVENVRQNSEEPLLATQSTEKNIFPEVSATDKQIVDAVKISESGVAPKFDELGNLKDYSGLADNVITADDDLFVRHAKQEQQLKEFWANNAELGEGLSVEDGAVTSGGGDVDNSIGGIELGGIQAHFELNGSESPQEVMQTIRENLGDLADQIGGKIAEKMSEIRMNMPLMA